jgi:glycosyltransferase involved in cell wall biosynthesis
LFKELSLAYGKFNCTVISFQLNNWSDELSDKLEEKLPGIQFKSIAAGRTPLLPWLISSLLEKVSRIIYPLLDSNLNINAYASNKRSYLLDRKLKRERTKYDLVIAHNLAALFPAYKFAQDTGSSFAFDIEDYHPGEVILADKKNETTRRKHLFRNILPHASYISYASPLIGEYTLKLLLNNYKKKHLFVPNCFPGTEFREPKPIAEENLLKLVWFSQHVSTGRGLEELLEAVTPLQNLIELHLIGHTNPEFVATYIAARPYIILHPPLPQTELHDRMAEFDVGLALEMTQTDINRNIALTNKIYAYAQAGLYVLATNTEGQKLFIENYPWTGEVTGQTPADLYNSITGLIEKKDVIRKQAVHRYYKSKKLSWENQSQQLLEVWKAVVKS